MARDYDLVVRGGTIYDGQGGEAFEGDVAVKDRRNGSLNPYAHLQQADITLESVQASPMLWDPVRYDETCPSSDGACAVVIGDESAAQDSLDGGRPVAWIRATAMRTGSRR